MKHSGDGDDGGGRFVTLFNQHSGCYRAFSPDRRAIVAVLEERKKYRTQRASPLA